MTIETLVRNVELNPFKNKKKGKAAEDIEKVEIEKDESVEKVVEAYKQLKLTKDFYYDHGKIRNYPAGQPRRRQTDRRRAGLPHRRDTPEPDSLRRAGPAVAPRPGAGCLPAGSKKKPRGGR